MKIIQDELGSINIQLNNNETYNLENHVEALMDFVCKQAITTYRLTNSYRKIVGRLDELERKVSETSK
jgi:hypothetical protein